MLDRPDSHLTRSEVAPPSPWGLGDALASVVTAWIVFFIGSVIVAILYRVADRHAADKYGLDIGMVGYQFLLLGTFGAAAIFVMRKHHVWLAALGYRYPGLLALAGAAASIVPVFLGVALIYFLFTTLLPQYNLRGNAQELLAGTSPDLTLAEKIGLFVFAVIEAPIVEETLFRGILYQGLRTFFSARIPRGWSVAVAAVISGTLFGVLHLEPHTLPVLIFFGIVLAYIFERSKSIYATMLVHGIFNLVAVVSLLQTQHHVQLHRCPVGHPHARACGSPTHGTPARHLRR